MKIKSTSLFSLFLIVVSTTFFTTSCKKSSGGSSGISATINGSGFNPGQTQAVDLQGHITAAGISVSGKDTTGIAVEFNDTVSVNKAQDIFASDNVIVTYTAKGAVYDSWSDHAHGTLTVSTLDKTGKKIAGSFSGVLYNSYGNGSTSDSIVVTNGTFNMTYTSY